MRSKEIEVCSACITSCKVSTNVPRGGDSGHGGVTTIVLKDLGGTDMSLAYSTSESEQYEVRVSRPTTITLQFGGDWEAQNIVKLLRLASFHLEEMIEQNQQEAVVARRDIFYPGDK